MKLNNRGSLALPPERQQLQDDFLINYRVKQCDVHKQKHKSKSKYDNKHYDKQNIQPSCKKLTLPKSNKYTCHSSTQQHQILVKKHQTAPPFQKLHRPNNLNIEEEYKLPINPYKQTPINTKQKNCPFALSQCKYIDHYMMVIRKQLSRSKQKNNILKRRNKQLQKQNRVFNQYFQVFDKQRYKRDQNSNSKSKRKQQISEREMKKSQKNRRMKKTTHISTGDNQSFENKNYNGQRKSKDKEFKSQIHNELLKQYHRRKHHNHSNHPLILTSTSPSHSIYHSQISEHPYHNKPQPSSVTKSSSFVKPSLLSNNLYEQQLSSSSSSYRQSYKKQNKKPNFY